MADIFNMADTWNAGGTTFTSVKMNATDTASAAASMLIDLQIGGVSKGRLKKDGELGVLSMGFASADANAPDVFFTRDAADILAQRNGTGSQTLRVYNTYTNASNYERLSISTGATSSIYQEQAGTGVARNLNIGTLGASAVAIVTGGAARWSFNASGHLLGVNDNTYDIGASGANRPRTGYFGTSVVTPILTTTTTTVGALGAATTAGQRKFVTDALTPVFGATVAAGGAVPVPVYADGTNWIVG